MFDCCLLTLALPLLLRPCAGNMGCQDLNGKKMYKFNFVKCRKDLYIALITSDNSVTVCI